MSETQKLQSALADERCQVGSVCLNNVNLVSLTINGEERVCLAQLSNTLLKSHSYNEIHNRRVALGITCVQCTPLQLEILRRSGAMPMSSRRCGMITKREAERLFRSFFNQVAPPNLPSDFVFNIYHECGWGCAGYFIPSRYNSSRAKCIKCAKCSAMFSPNKFIFHYHKTNTSGYIHPDAANFNSWRRHIKLSDKGKSKEIEYAWEDVKALFNGGSRKRTVTPPIPSIESQPSKHQSSETSSMEKISNPVVVYPHKKLDLSTYSLQASHALNPLLRHPLTPSLTQFWQPAQKDVLRDVFGARTSLPISNWSCPLLPDMPAPATNHLMMGLMNIHDSLSYQRSMDASSTDSFKLNAATDIKRPWM